MEFEWDEHKRLSNLAKHGIDFVRARDLFDGRLVIHLSSAHTQEDRHLTIGRLNGVFVTVVWTRRSEALRIISVRRSRPAEIALLRDQIGI